MRVEGGRLPCRCAMYNAGSSLRTERSPAPPKMIMSSGRDGAEDVAVVVMEMSLARRPVLMKSAPV